MSAVPVLSMAGMAFSLAVSIGVPVALLVLLKKRTGAKLTSALYGAGTFILFALVLESLLHRLVFSVFGERLTGNLWLYVLYGGLAAGLFEEGGRWITMTFLMKQRLDRDNALMFGAGHGGVEAVLLIALAYVSNLAASVMINSGAMTGTLDALDEAASAETVAQLSALWTTPSWMFFAAGFERVAAIALQIGLSYLVYRAVKTGRVTLWLLAVALHAGVDAMAVILGQLISPLLAELAVYVVVALLWSWLWPRLRAEGPSAPAEQP